MNRNSTYQVLYDAIRTALIARRNRRIVYAASAGVFQRFVQLASTLLVMPLVLRVLGPANFGIWGAATSLAWLSGLVDIGSGTALVTLVAHSIAAEDKERARHQVTAALALGSIFAVLILAATAFTSRVGGPQAKTEAYLIAIAGLAINAPLNTANNIWMAIQKGYVSGFWELVQTLWTATGLLIATFCTVDVRILTAIVYCGLVFGNAGSLAHLLWRHPELRPTSPLVPYRAFREVTKAGIMYFALALMSAIALMLDNVLALELLGADAAAKMAIASRVCLSALGIVAVASQPLWPAFADAAQSRDGNWIRRGLLTCSAMFVGGAGVSAVLLIATGKNLLAWWLHSTLDIGTGLICAMGAWIVVQTMVRIPSLLLNGLAIVRFQVLVCTIGSLSAFALKLVLVHFFGVAGILWGTTATAFLIVFPALVWRIDRWADDTVRPKPTLPVEFIETMPATRD